MVARSTEDVDAMDKQQQQFIREMRAAIKKGDVHQVEALLGSDKARLNMMTVFGTWLHVAAAHGQLEVVKRLVAMGADVHAYGGIEGGGALNLAAAKGHIDVVQYLLSCGAKLDVSEPERNPLFGAVYGGHLDIVKLLVARGIDFRLKYSGSSMKNMDALAFAQEWGQSEIAEFLAER
jgi:ankyrin repeat protein